MLKHILVTLESTKYADYVLAHAQNIAHACDAQITLLRLFDNITGRNRIVDPLDWHIRKMEVQSTLNKMADGLRRQGLTVETVVLEGSDTEQLVNYVQTHEVDLVILPKQSESTGDLVHTLMKRTSTPVVILPVGVHLLHDNNKTECYQKILVPLDGSQRAEVTLPLATALARHCNAQLLLTHIVRKPEMPRHAPPNAEEAELVDRLVELNHEKAERYLENLATRVQGEVQTRLLVSDNITATLHQVVEQENVDLVMLSAHGYSGEPQWPYGSITSHLIAYSTKPVLVVQDLPATVTQTSEIPAVARSAKAH